MALGKGKPGSKGQICISTQLGVQYWGRSVHNTRFVGHEKPGCGMREEHITLPAENLRHPGVNRSIRTPVIQNKQLLFFIEAHRAALARGVLGCHSYIPSRREEPEKKGQWTLCLRLSQAISEDQRVLQMHLFS